MPKSLIQCTELSLAFKVADCETQSATTDTEREVYIENLVEFTKIKVDGISARVRKRYQLYYEGRCIRPHFRGIYFT